MNTDLAETYRTEIAGLSFVDRIAGLVRPVSISDQSETGGRILKTFPVACNVSAKDCTTKGKYQDLVPNSGKKSIIYFEDGGIQNIGRDNHGIKFRSLLNIICWLNLPKLGVSDCNFSAKAALGIISKLPYQPFNFAGMYTRCSITGISEAKKNNAIFAPYTYDETVTQYLMYPYDYFMLTVITEFTVPLSCIEEILASPSLNCPEK